MKYLYETHMHTSEVSACATSTAAEQVRSYAKRGYAGIITTDHFINGNSTCPANAPWDVKMRKFVSGFNAARAEGEKCGIDVFLGWEYTIDGLDFLTYGLGLDFLLANPDIDYLTIEEYSSLVRSSGGYIAQAHPYRSAWYITHGGAVDWRYIDGVEVYNASDPVEANAKALQYAEAYKLPKQAGSDSHNATVPFSSTHCGIKLGRRANDIFDIIDALMNKKAEISTK